MRTYELTKITSADLELCIVRCPHLSACRCDTADELGWQSWINDDEDWAKSALKKNCWSHWFSTFRAQFFKNPLFISSERVNALVFTDV